MYDFELLICLFSFGVEIGIIIKRGGYVACLLLLVNGTDSDRSFAIF
jgi:hypothetical protein